MTVSRFRGAIRADAGLARATASVDVRAEKTMDQSGLNEIVQWIFGALVAAVVLGLFGWYKFKRDEKLVTEVLRKSPVDSRAGRKTSYEISSVTKLHEKRVRKICRKSTRIKKENDGSWRLHE